VLGRVRERFLSGADDRFRPLVQPAGTGRDRLNTNSEAVLDVLDDGDQGSDEIVTVARRAAQPGT
jgi:hypothetical protein